MRRPLRSASGVVLAGTVVACRPGTRANRMLRHGLSGARRRAGRIVRRDLGRIQGYRYHLAGRRPDPDVDDNVLADRIRSELGGLEKARDLPRIHVMVEDHVALLHGDVPAPADAAALERAVAAVSGVNGVESHLHVGLMRGDTRPSEGHRAIR